MNKELFGVFGGSETFERFRSRDEFDEVLSGPSLTVAIRDPGLDYPGWSATYADETGCCVIWGEAYVPGDEQNAARWLLDQYDTHGLDALDTLNGSYLAVLDIDGETPFVATDLVRSRECFYTDDPGPLVFGTDAAEVGQTIPDPSLDRNGILEFLHMGLALGEKTWIDELSRLPIDSRLTPHGVDSLSRFVYRPADPDAFDYVDELASRLERALRRRSSNPGPKGLLLSAGYDSRIVLSQVDDIDHCYTVGSPDAQEVQGAKRVANQYGATHTAFQPDERYLLADESKVQYSQGIKESLHIHHAGYTDELTDEVETMYHGLLCDTFFRGHFTAQDGVDVLGTWVPFQRLDPDPDPVAVFLDKYGYSREQSIELTERTGIDNDPEQFVEEAIAAEFAANRSRAECIQNALTCCGIANQPSVPFHNHLADQFFAPFLATDRELLEWHLRTPPRLRTTETFLQACKQLDDDILRHRPPDRPHDGMLLNEVEGFVRRKTPLLTSFEPPWPDRRTLFEKHGFNDRLLGEYENIHPIAPRHKLRVADLQTWLDSWDAVASDTIPWLQSPPRIMS
ncbi:asparagine synthase-related protein [Natrialba taiwanensis]|nr:asparagine synthase-related protein [Natrialba taiwanensis]